MAFYTNGYNEITGEYNQEGFYGNTSDMFGVDQGDGSTADIIINGGTVTLDDSFPSTFPCELTWDGIGDIGLSVPGFDFRPKGVDLSLFDKIQELRELISEINDYIIGIIYALECCLDPDLYNNTILRVFKWLVEDEDGFCGILTKLVRELTIIATTFKTLICFIKPVPGNPWLAGSPDPLESIYAPFGTVDKIINEIMTGSVLNYIIGPLSEVRDYLKECYEDFSDQRAEWNAKWAHPSDGISPEGLRQIVVDFQDPGLYTGDYIFEENDPNTNEDELLTGLPELGEDISLEDFESDYIPIPPRPGEPDWTPRDQTYLNELNELDRVDMFLSEDRSQRDPYTSVAHISQINSREGYENYHNTKDQEARDNWHNMTSFQQDMALRSIMTGHETDVRDQLTSDYQQEVLQWRIDKEQIEIENENRKAEAYRQFLEAVKQQREQELEDAGVQKTDEYIDCNEIRPPQLTMPNEFDFSSPLREKQLEPKVRECFCSPVSGDWEYTEGATQEEFDEIKRYNDSVDEYNTQIKYEDSQRFEISRNQALDKYNLAMAEYRLQVEECQEQNREITDKGLHNDNVIEAYADTQMRADAKPMCFCIGDLIMALTGIPMYTPEWVTVSTYAEFDQKVKGRHLYSDASLLMNKDEDSKEIIEYITLDNVDGKGGWTINSNNINPASWGADYEVVQLPKATIPTEVLKNNAERLKIIQEYKRQMTLLYTRNNAMYIKYYNQWKDERKSLIRDIRNIEIQQQRTQIEILKDAKSAEWFPDTWESKFDLYYNYESTKYDLEYNSNISNEQLQLETYYTDFVIDNYLSPDEKAAMDEIDDNVEYLSNAIRQEEDQIKGESFTITLISDTPIPCTCNILCDLLQLLVNLITQFINEIINEIMAWITEAMMPKEVKYIIRFILAKLQCLIDLLFLKEKIDIIKQRADEDLRRAKGMLNELEEDPRCLDGQDGTIIEPIDPPDEPCPEDEPWICDEWDIIDPIYEWDPPHCPPWIPYWVCYPEDDDEPEHWEPEDPEPWEPDPWEPEEDPEDDDEDGMIHGKIFIDNVIKPGELGY